MTTFPNTNRCPHNTTYLASVEFLETGCHIGSIFMITLSSYSLWLIAKKSPTSMKSSVPYMINLHVLTMFCDLTWAVLVLPMFFMPVIAAHSSGLLLYVTENQTVLLWICFATLGGMCAGIMSLFEHRHQVIVTNSWFVMRRKWTRRIFFVLLYFVMVNFGIPEILTVPEDQDAEKLKAFNKYPCLPVIIFDETSRIIQSDASLFNPHMYLTCASLGGLVCFYCGHIMWNLLPRNNPSMSSGTRKMLVSFFISMCIQVAIPVIVIYIPNIYWNVSITLDFYSQAYKCFIQSRTPMRVYINCGPDDSGRFDALNQHCDKEFIECFGDEISDADENQCGMLTKMKTKVIRLMTDGRYEEQTVYKYSFPTTANITFIVAMHSDQSCEAF